MLYLINGNAWVFRFFSTGQSFRSLASSFRMDHYIVGRIVDQIDDVLWSRLLSKHLSVPDHDRFLYTAVSCHERWNFPNVSGCIDGKHVRLKCRTNAGSLFYNWKHFFSVVLRGVADSESGFIFINIGAFGKQSDCDTFLVLLCITSWKT